MVLSYECKTCYHNYWSYDYSADLGTNFNIKNSDVSTRKYGTAEVTGFYATAEVCLGNGTRCVNDFDIFMATS